MAKGMQKRWLQLLAALLCCALMLALPLPALAEASSASGQDSSASGASDASDASDASGTEGEGEEEDSLLAPAGQGLYKPEYEPLAEAWCMVNEDTGLVVSEKNADTSMAAASLVKMMTCILVMERLERFGEDMDNTFVDSTGKTWVYDRMADYRAATGSEPSTADIRKGEILSVRELLYAALLPSANEAALLLADWVCTGYLVNFSYMINTHATVLGCTGTYFEDGSGLSAQNVTTARDMVKITRAFMSYPELVEIAATTSYEMAAHEKHANPYYIHTTNRLLVGSSPYSKIFGGISSSLVAGKTGSLEDWQNFASMATKGGETYICVVLHSPGEADQVAPTLDLETPANPRPALYEAAGLYAWAFSALGVRSALDITQPVTELRVKYSTEQDTVRLLPIDDVRAVLPSGAADTMVRRVYDLPTSVAAPVKEGTVMGSVKLYVGDVLIGSSQLVAARDVQRNSTLYMLNRVGGFFTSLYFRVLLVLVLLAAAVYAGALLLMHQSRQRRRAGPAQGPGGQGPAKRRGAKRPKGETRANGAAKGAAKPAGRDTARKAQKKRRRPPARQGGAPPPPPRADLDPYQQKVPGERMKP